MVVRHANSTARGPDLPNRVAAAPLLLVTVVLQLSLVGWSETTPAPSSTPGEIRVMCYNTYCFAPSHEPQVKTPESRDAVADVIAHVDPDIMLLTEVGGAAALAEIAEGLAARGKTYVFSSVVEGEDQERRMAFLAKLRPVQVSHDVTSFYNLNGRHVRVQRGFGHCVFQWAGDLRLHIVGAHLKSKMYHHLGQTDMRRYEARQLRYLYNEILKAEPKANVLIVGDMNDTPDSSPVSTLCGRRYKVERQLFDLRPVDRYNMAWTHLWDTADTYSRIDYAFASFALLPAIDFDRTVIPYYADWYVASDHRPVVVTLHPPPADTPSGLLSRFERNQRIPPVPQSSFGQGRVVGTRKVRR